MPPVIGAVTFLMANITDVPYLQIILAALVTVLMYYGLLSAIVYVEPRKNGIESPPTTELKMSAKDFVLPLSGACCCSPPPFSPRSG